MATNGATSGGSTGSSDISIDLSTPEQADPSTASVSIPAETGQTVRATVEASEAGRWHCDFRVDPRPDAVSAPAEEGPLTELAELAELAAAVVDFVETVTEVGC